MMCESVDTWCRIENIMLSPHFRRSLPGRMCSERVDNTVRNVSIRSYRNGLYNMCLKSNNIFLNTMTVTLAAVASVIT